MSKRNQLNILFAATALTLVSCQNSQFELQQLEMGARETLVCEQNFDHFNDHIYNFWLNKHDLPSDTEFQNYLDRGLREDPTWKQTPKKNLAGR